MRRRSNKSEITVRKINGDNLQYNIFLISIIHVENILQNTILSFQA